MTIPNAFKGPDLVINCPDAILDGKRKNVCVHRSTDSNLGMNDWCRQHHGESGLTAKVKASKITVEEAERQVLEFVKQHIPTARVAPLAGNSIHADRYYFIS